MRRVRCAVGVSLGAGTLIWLSRSAPDSSVLASASVVHVLVHIPKTGGQSLRKLLSTDACSGAAHEGSHAHALVESRVLAAGKRPLVVLREPLERLHSAYEYWRTGSEMPSMRKLRSPQATLMLRKLSGISFAQFLEGFANKTSPYAAAAETIIHLPRHISGWAWEDHFAPQRQWMDVESHNTTIVCYDSKLLRERVRCALDALHLRCNTSALGHTNRLVHGQTSPSITSLQTSLRAMVRARLRADYSLYERHCARCGAHCRCCHRIAGGTHSVSDCGHDTSDQRE